jgi:hypothetical protein
MVRELFVEIITSVSKYKMLQKHLIFRSFSLFSMDLFFVANRCLVFDGFRGRDSPREAQLKPFGLRNFS